MKTIFTSKEVAHVWAQQRQSNGRNAGKSLFFEGATIYSYGVHFPIARFYKDVVLFNRRDYSVTTSKHKGYVLDALRGVCDVIYVDEPTQERIDIEKEIQGVREAIARSGRSRKGWSKTVHLNTGARLLHNLKQAMSVFGQGPTDEQTLEISKLEDLINQLEEEVRAFAQKEQKAIKQKQMESFAKWRAGETKRAAWSPFDAIRLKGGYIQTVRGATIDLDHARKLWDAIKNQQAVEGLDLGNYRVDRIEGDHLVVGCHRIPMDEINAMAEKLGWK